MKLIEKINNLFSYDRYYKMSEDDLAKEASKYCLQRIYNPASLKIEKTEVIKQLIAKDNASMFKKSLIISVFTLMVVIISLVISIIAILIK
ncbi:MAG: hypothetical protein H8E13_17610 [Actinobacteria bacterium]|nr:hypothetical protein [Actinomycetota bacterium]